MAKSATTSTISSCGQDLTQSIGRTAHVNSVFPNMNEKPMKVIGWVVLRGRGQPTPHDIYDLLQNSEQKRWQTGSYYGMHVKNHITSTYVSIDNS